MIERLDIRNFTVFSEAEFQFSPGLNLIVGENGSGKTHVLKLAYSIAHCLTFVDANDLAEKLKSNPVDAALARKMFGVFRPHSLANLIRRRRNVRNCEVDLTANGKPVLSCKLWQKGASSITVVRPEMLWFDALPVFFPTREVLSLCPWFVSLYDTVHLPLEETLRDTCLLLNAPMLRDNHLKTVESLLAEIERAIGGHAETDEAGRFVFIKDNERFEIHLVADGYRKLAMLARLIATGHLGKERMLFWDEPEANLNPKLVKVLARVILHLCRSGVQMFLATHSLFLMRELDILLRCETFHGTPSRFFGLHLTKSGMHVEQGDSIDDVGEITALQESLSQSDRYLDVEDAT